MLWFAEPTGYRFISPPSYNLGQLSSGGDFGRLVALLISNAPVVTFSAAQQSAYVVGACLDFICQD